jgi:mRNA-degrading endonuclease toxin of MazEF toxin-antitoxin module
MIRRKWSRGDVVLATIPFTDLQAGKVRPAVILSDGLIQQDVILAAISSVVRSAALPSDIVLEARHPDFPRTGLLKTSVVRTHRLVTVEERVVVRHLGQLSSSWWSEVETQMRILFGL